MVFFTGGAYASQVVAQVACAQVSQEGGVHQMNVIYREDEKTHELLAFVTFVGHKFMYKLGTKDEVESLGIEQLENLIIGAVLNSGTAGETIH